MERITFQKNLRQRNATVFEDAVKSKIRDEVERLEEEYKTELNKGL